ncbi:MAG: response regulator transcription factor [Bacteroidetes bacterium]|nr:response regulator transcription factor [Bacteroidota bacterium]
MEIRCLIVDDEVLAQDVIEKYIESIPTLKLIGKCDHAMEAISFLHNNPIDLIFLDLNMPELNGLEMLRTLHNPPNVILTTAYSEYALESYEYGVVDYLLKPIKFERFIKAVNKVVDMYSIKAESEHKDSNLSKPIFIKEDHTTHAILPENILYVEAYGNYLKIYTIEKTYVTRQTMQYMVGQLPDSIFCRIHKSYIVNKLKITKVIGNMVFIKDIELPIGSTYKTVLLH